MPPSLILFDIDGTLVDTAGAGRRAMERAFERVLGVDGIAALARALPFAGMTDWAIFDALGRASGAGEERCAAARGEIEREYLTLLRGEMDRRDERRRVLPGVRALLERLVVMPEVHLGLLTGNLEAGARIKLEPFDLNRFFPAGGFGSDHADRREVARVARERLSRLHGVEFDPVRVCVVGDTDQDVMCARANGFRVVAVEAGWGTRASLAAAGPDALLATLEDPHVLVALGLDGVGPA